jgi:hypothetical protein
MIDHSEENMQPETIAAAHGIASDTAFAAAHHRCTCRVPMSLPGTIIRAAITVVGASRLIPDAILL